MGILNFGISKIMKIFVIVFTLLSSIILIYILITGKHQISNAKEYKDYKSPWLGISFQQHGKYVKSERIEQPKHIPDAPYYLNKLELSSGDFKIKVPKNSSEDEIKIVAWTDKSIFKKAKGGVQATKIPMFDNGRGFATTKYGPFALFINNEGFNYFFETRLGTKNEEHHIVFTGFSVKNEKNEYIDFNAGKIYMIVFMDINKNGFFDHTEYEFYQIVLN